MVSLVDKRTNGVHRIGGVKEHNISNRPDKTGIYGIAIRVDGTWVEVVHLESVLVHDKITIAGVYSRTVTKNPDSVTCPNCLEWVHS